ncbi:MAG: hypothetical protein KME23_19425 [Goleter apudmare HA4340-LM2]|nr:hypothetical protein [Goleter apudmare HA4340-LM2]
MKDIEDNHKKSHLKTVTTAIMPLQLPEENIIDGWECLALQAQRINQMAAELEAMILQLKTMATNLNSQTHYQQSHKQPSVCEYLTVSVPWITQQPNETFVLTTRKVDLFRAEREALVLAQQLRQRTRRKSLGSQWQRKNQHLVDIDTKKLLNGALVNKS